MTGSTSRTEVAGILWSPAKRSKVELYEQIRMAHDRDELSIRALARRFGVHRRLVRDALSSPVPEPRKVAQRPSPAIRPWKETIDGWLADDRSTRADLVGPNQVIAEMAERPHVALDEGLLGRAGLPQRVFACLAIKEHFWHTSDARRPLPRRDGGVPRDGPRRVAPTARRGGGAREPGQGERGLPGASPPRRCDEPLSLRRGRSTRVVPVLPERPGQVRPAPLGAAPRPLRPRRAVAPHVPRRAALTRCRREQRLRRGAGCRRASARACQGCAQQRGDPRSEARRPRAPVAGRGRAPRAGGPC